MQPKVRQTNRQANGETLAVTRITYLSAAVCLITSLGCQQLFRSLSDRWYATAAAVLWIQLLFYAASLRITDLRPSVCYVVCSVRVLNPNL